MNDAQWRIIHSILIDYQTSLDEMNNKLQKIVDANIEKDQGANPFDQGSRHHREQFEKK